MKMEKKDLEKQMMASGFAPNMISGGLMMPYIFFFSGVQIGLVPKALLIGVIVMGILQNALAPFTNRLITKSVSKRIIHYAKKETTVHERTVLLKDLMGIPKYVALQVFLIFLGGCIIWLTLCKFIAGFSSAEAGFAITAGIFGSIISALFSLNMAENVCSMFAKPFVDQGVDSRLVAKFKFFGMPVKTSFNFYVVFPLVFSTIILLFLLWIGYLSETPLLHVGSTEAGIMRVLIIFISNVLFCVFLSRMYFNKIIKSNHQITETMITIVSKGAMTTALLPSDLANELSYNAYLINQTILLFRDIFGKAGKIASSVMQSTQDLVLTSRETESISIEQSSSVKEIVATMEDADKLSRNIATRIAEVALVANKTTEDVQNGFTTLATNLQKMNEITEANIETIKGIKALSEKIESIWDIVNIINSIADQTKIIAFNAELEAASAGEAGKNFHIVANEIRRLADLTTNSTKAIKSRITEIQHSSDNLIITSEGGTEKIHEGCELSVNLETNFENIKSSAEITAESSNDIKDIINQQTYAFEQIVITLRQISESIENFSVSTQTVTNASENLRRIADDLSNIMAAK